VNEHCQTAQPHIYETGVALDAYNKLRADAAG
jgi:hypothetical protein